MFINPKVAIEKGWIRGIKDPAKQVQPNAIDFTLDKVMAFLGGEVARLSESVKQMRALEMYEPTRILTMGDETPFWVLQAQKVYDGMSDIYVEVPEGAAAILYTRSTFARNGVFITSGLYDSGYKGNIGFTIYTVGGSIDIGVGTRIGQVAFVSADTALMYEGGWNHQQGTHWAEQNTAIGIQVGTPNYSEVAKQMEETGKWNSNQVGPVAGTKDFI